MRAPGLRGAADVWCGFNLRGVKKVMGYFRLLGMDKEPFSTSPDPFFFYGSREHQAVLLRLMSEIRLRRGLSVVLGDVGTGKTTLSRKLFQMLEKSQDIDLHVIFDPFFSSEEMLLDALARTFGIHIPPGPVSVLASKEALKHHLFQRGVNEKKTIVLLIDEAQKLTLPALETLRGLLNFETNDFKLLQLVLLGQNELLPNIRSLRNFWDRISYRHVFRPFDMEATREMIEFRVRHAGYKPSRPLFTDDAIAAIYAHTQGYPRRTAMLCHDALKAIVMYNKLVVDGAVVQELIEQDACLTV